MSGTPRFKANWLEWTVGRRDQTFRAYVVEPTLLRPSSHAHIFHAVLSLFSPQGRQELQNVQAGAEDQQSQAAEPFDLLTFPEAFLPAKTLVEVLEAVGAHGYKLGCVHVGLRPSGVDDQDGHLFSVSTLRALVADLKSIDTLLTADLEAFSSWLSEQHISHKFNIGCLFAVDAADRIRVCLHAKFVRSKSEVSPIADLHMAEANLLSLVTLRPTENELSSVTIQPTICADVLDLPTDKPNNRPLEALIGDPSCFSRIVADHVDIISVATCTINRVIGGERKLEWHQKFRESFRRAASGSAFQRHHFAAFVLSNFRYVGDSTQASTGGLSGIFVPLPAYAAQSPYETKVSAYKCILGRFPLSDNRTEEEERWESGTKWNDIKSCPVLGYIVALDPQRTPADAEATIFGFTLNRLPRDANRWERTGTIAKFTWHDATPATAPSGLEFKPRSANT